jgi:acyl-CoA synthetase (AMP-forming)/AMP-acid ligase II
MGDNYDSGANREMPAALTASWTAQGLWSETSLAEAFAAAAQASPGAMLHHHALAGWDEASLGEVHARGLVLAGSLHALGLRQGDVVAMQMPSGIENAVIVHAVTALGCVLLPIVHIFGPRELGQVLGDSGARALIVPDRWRNIDFLDRLARLPDLPALKHRIVVGENVPPGALAYHALPGGDCPQVKVDPGALALLLYTSGTTAAPKGVRHTSRSLIAETRTQFGEAFRNGAGLSPWPSGHIAGTMAVLAHGVQGREMVLMESWNPTVAAELVERFRVPSMSGTPFHLSGLLEAAARDGRDVSSVGQFIIGAATVPPALVAASEEAGIRCCRCYGSTEIPTVTQCDPDDPLDKRLNTDGTVNAGCEVRIVDDHGQDVPIGIEGEVAARGPERFTGYTDPALDAASFLPGGWFLTGDIGKLDAEGYLAITDRKKDIIIRGGENISSREVEELLLTIPGVRDAAAIGLPDPRMGEKVCAVLMLEPGTALTIAAIDAAFRDLGVARQKTPEALVIAPDFPRTPSGKTQKAELRRMVAAGELSLAG